MYEFYAMPLLFRAFFFTLFSYSNLPKKVFSFNDWFAKNKDTVLNKNNKNT